MNSKLQDTPVMREVSLSDKFDVMEGTIFITGKQALSRVPLLQRLLDDKRGLRTAGYISGYRGSPLGAGAPEDRRSLESRGYHLSARAE